MKFEKMNFCFWITPDGAMFSDKKSPKSQFRGPHANLLSMKET